MKRQKKDYIGPVQLFEPEPDTVYTIETAGQLAHTSRRAILIYCKNGLVSTMSDPARDGYYFDSEAVRTLRLIEFLREDCGVNLPGIKMILQLINEVGHLRDHPAACKHSINDFPAMADFHAFHSSGW